MPWLMQFLLALAVRELRKSVREKYIEHGSQNEMVKTK